MEKETIKPFKLGKKMKLEYIAFSKLIDPWLLTSGNAKYCREKAETIESIPLGNSRPLKTIKNTELTALALSIKQFGLLNPFTVWELKEPRKNEIYHGEKYLIIDGQRRYFALKKFYNLRSNYVREQDERNNGHIIMICGNNSKVKDETPKTLSIEDYLLIPCIVYNYDNIGECMRHSVEDNKFGVRPLSEYVDSAERKGDNLPNMKPEDIQEFYEINNKLAELNDEINDKATKEEEKHLKEEAISELQEKLKKIESGQYQYEET